ncbi:MAG: glycosyltransferase [Herpetosiphonaceae bacterium]|nr:glycosyltransferase [Herpetosiphonaceae bacterium]
MDEMQADVVCISHLWWNWVWQRPQQLITRLAQHHRVFWTEEPHIEIGPPSDAFEITEEAPHLTLGRLILRSDADTFVSRLKQTLTQSGADNFRLPAELREASLLFESSAQERLEREVVEYVSAWRHGPLVLWLYTPIVANFIDLLKPDLVVYDVMDELTAFKYAPPRLKQQEQALLQRADLVFTGGPSLYEARRSRRPDVHLFPSGVDRQHFAQELPAPLALRDLPHPIIGFFGVIDERIDLELLARAAQARPDWNWVMIGPVLKIEEQSLPREVNIHYLGKQAYGDLPTYLRAFDVAMLPFALNEATQFISPTKTLEYMAAHKPIVSTPIKDVSTLYGSVVRIAATAEAFVAQIEAALGESAGESDDRHHRELELLQRYEWDQIAAQMNTLIEERLQQKLHMARSRSR